MLRAASSGRRLPSSLPRSVTARSTTSTSGGPLVIVEKHSPHVRVIKLNNPAKLNALTVPLGHDFLAAIKEVSQDKEVRAVVLTGEGKAFSAGGDLAWLRERQGDTPDHNSLVMLNFYKMFLSIRRVHVPVISAINGAAIGAGMCLAMATDIRYAALKAKLGFTFVSLGLHPGERRPVEAMRDPWCPDKYWETHPFGVNIHYNSFVWNRLVGAQVANRLLLTGDVITGADAARVGLVDEALPPEEVLSTSLKVAETIARQSPVAVKATLKTLRVSQDEGFQRALVREADAQAQSYASKDFKEGLSAVADKRTPTFP